MKKIISTLIVFIIFILSAVTVNAESTGTVKVVSNGDTVFIIEPDGTVMGCGKNTEGELGIGTTTNQTSLVSINGLNNIKDIIIGDSGYFLALDYSGYIYSWGENGSGQLGFGDTADRLTPEKIDSISGVSSIAVDSDTVYALTTDGYVYAWGDNSYGEIGNGTKTNQLTPYMIESISEIKDIVCADDSCFAVTTDGYVYAWGSGSGYKMGNGEYISAQTTPVIIEDLSGVDEVITNGETMFAICDDYCEVYSWGEGWNGELGNSAERNRSPERIDIISDLDTSIDKLIIEKNTCYVIMSDGTLYAWGDGWHYQLATNSAFDRNKPILVSDLSDVIDITFTGYTAVALCGDGNVYVWGRDLVGTSGTGSTCIIMEPQTVSGVADIKAIYNGTNAIYAIDEDGYLYSWGNNDYGQLGTGADSGIYTAELVSGISDVSEVIKVGNSVYAVTADNMVYGWGDNGYGQIGDGTYDNVLVPYELYSSSNTTTTGIGNVLSTVPVVGTINALEVSITHPLSISYTIDPNIEDGFICPDIEIQNNSKVPVMITIESFSASEGDNTFQDVMPDSLDWDNLNRSDTLKYIALGIEYVDESQWLISEGSLPLYAAEIVGNDIGVLVSGSTGTLRFNCYHGLAFNKSFTAEHEIIFTVSLV